MSEVLRGGCACGRVRFSYSDTPIAEVVCHCVDCQKASGGAFAALMFVAGDRLAMQGDEPRYFASTAKSGRTLERGFCGACGTPVVMRWPQNDKLKLIYAGGLDQPDVFAPTMEVWCSQSPAWQPTVAGVSKSDDGPDGDAMKAIVRAHFAARGV